jgi:H2-forming N5,N10-methylenetetrahydromethanopterin dehydrogenase-like enzyme
MNGTMIMTGKPVDEATQQAIRSLLESAGHDGEVRFMDRERIHESHQQVRIIEERVEISE